MTIIDPKIHNNDNAVNGGMVEASGPEDDEYESSERAFPREQSWESEDLQRDAMQRGRDLAGE